MATKRTKKPKNGDARRHAKRIPRTRSERGRYWSREVTERSDALDLEPHVFRQTDPRKVAASLKRSAEASTRRKGNPYQSAMSMLNFYINRAGRGLPATQKRVLERAKDELRTLFKKRVDRQRRIVPGSTKS
jgi:hypothetical protein